MFSSQPKFISTLSLSLFISTPVTLLATPDCTIQAPNASFIAKGGGVTIVKSGNGRVINKKGEVIGNTSNSIKDLTNGKCNSGIHIRENLRIAAMEDSTVIVQAGDGTIIYETNEESLEQLGIAKDSLATFFGILQYNNIPLEDWSKKLEEIAKNYQELKQRLSDINSRDQRVLALRDQADIAVDKGQFELADQLLAQIDQLVMTPRVEDRLFTSAQALAMRASHRNAASDYAQAAKLYHNAAKKLFAANREYPAKKSLYLHRAGIAYLNTNDSKSALPLLVQALEIRQESNLATKAIMAATLHSLAQAYRLDNQQEKSIEVFGLLLQVYEGALGGDHPKKDKIIKELKQLYQPDPTPSFPTMEQVVLEKAESYLPQTHPAYLLLAKVKQVLNAH